MINLQLLELELVITERHVSSYVCSLEPSPSRVSRAQTCTTTYTCVSYCLSLITLICVVHTPLSCLGA